MKPDLTQVQHREFTARAEATAEAREIHGVGVPLDDEVTIARGFKESFAQDCEFEGIERAKLHYRHGEVIGVITGHERATGKLAIRSRVSETRAGDDALVLARDGALDSFSIGFVPVEWTERDDEDGISIRHTKVRVREFSLVPSPAYPNATITEVREDRTPKGIPMPPTDTQEREDVAELRDDLADVKRSIAVLLDRGDHDQELPADTRSAGEWLRALAAGDQDMVREYEQLVASAYPQERAYEGGTSADGIRTPQWVGDTIRLVEAPNPLGQLFSTGTLPSKGLQLEYGVLESDTVDVDEQVNEGDDLTKGAIKVDVEHAPIKTYGGHVEMTRQQIERTTNVNVLNLHIRALGNRAARRKAAVLRAHYAAVVAANATNPDRVIVVPDVDDYLEWVGGIVDAAERYQDLGLSLDALVVDKTLFKGLAGLTGTDGRPLMRISGTGVNTVGEITPRALGGDLAGVRVVVNLKQTAAGGAFINSEAIRQYNGSITELADENIVNLSKRYGLYYYASLATEIPEAILPVVATAPEPAPEG